MIFEHDIPSGSKLYFGKSAKIKREIEFISSEILDNLGFEEIVTPLFSYHQHESFEDLKPLIRLNDEHNHKVTLRADCTADVVRIVSKRLGRSSESKKWFYVQPIVSFPTTEQYQIGAELIDGSFEESINSAVVLLKEIGATPVLQIANISIPELLSENYGISLEILKSMNIEDILGFDLEWIEQLVKINCVEDLTDLSAFPSDIKEQLEKIKKSIQNIAYENIVISPLYYAKMRYYDSLTFRMFENNALLAKGGVYTIDGVEASGFALYTDECVASKMSKEEDLV